MAPVERGTVDCTGDSVKPLHLYSVTMPLVLGRRHSVSSVRSAAERPRRGCVLSREPQFPIQLGVRIRPPFVMLTEWDVDSCVDKTVDDTLAYFGYGKGVASLKGLSDAQVAEKQAKYGRNGT